jgi:nicotinate-nucleotide adenylyltransferase
MTCIVILGGSFDPVHLGHLTIAECMLNLFQPTQLRIVPSGWSWQKKPFHASAADRVAMLTLAFNELAQHIALVIDQQEIQRAELGMPSYTVDTLANLRNEFGADAALIFIVGADQFDQLHSWKNWRSLFDLAHLVVVSRSQESGVRSQESGGVIDNVGWASASSAQHSPVAQEFIQRAATPAQLRNHPFGHTYFYTDLAVHISSTQIRQGQGLAFLPPEVHRYIQQHHLYTHQS